MAFKLIYKLDTWGHEQKWLPKWMLAPVCNALDYLIMK